MTNKQYYQNSNFNKPNKVEILATLLGFTLFLSGIFSILYLAVEYGNAKPEVIIKTLK